MIEVRGGYLPVDSSNNGQPKTGRVTAGNPNSASNRFHSAIWWSMSGAALRAVATPPLNRKRPSASYSTA